MEYLTPIKIKVGIICGLSGLIISAFFDKSINILFVSTFYSFLGGVFILPALFTEILKPYWKLNFICGLKGIAYVKLAIKIIIADGEIKEKEIEKLSFYMQHKYGDSILKPLSIFVQEYKNSSEPINKICRPLEDLGKSEQVEIFYRLFTIAVADKIFSEREEAVLKEIAKGLYIEEKRFNIIKNSFIKEKGYKYGSEQQRSRQNQSQNYYVLDELVKKSYNPFAVLGLDQNASNEELKRTYRKLAKLYHPDKSMMESEEIRKRDSFKMLEINEAYESIKKMRGIK